MRPKLLMQIALVSFAVFGNAHAQQDEEQKFSEGALEQAQPGVESEVTPRGGRRHHTGTIKELHINLDLYATKQRGLCIQMNPPINGTWACLWTGGRTHPSIWELIMKTGHQITYDHKSAAGAYFWWKGYDDMSRLLNDAFLHNKRCSISYVEPGYYDINWIRTVSCFSQ